MLQFCCLSFQSVMIIIMDLDVVRDVCKDVLEEYVTISMEHVSVNLDTLAAHVITVRNFICMTQI